MNKKVISISQKMNGGMDDDYTLYDDGTVLHEYDRHVYRGGFNLKDSLTVDDLSDSIKQRLFDSATDDNKEQVRNTLKLAVEQNISNS